MHKSASAAATFGAKFKGKPAWAAGIAAALIVVAVVSFLAGSSGSSANGRHAAVGHTSTSSQREPSEMTMDLGIAFGWTRAQVLAKLGQPTAKRPSCWIYEGRKTIPASYRALYIDGVEFCFSAGPIGGEVMTKIMNHSPAHAIIKRSPITHTIISKQTIPARWTPMFTFRRPPDWYLQQSS